MFLTASYLKLRIIDRIIIIIVMQRSISGNSKQNISDIFGSYNNIVGQVLSRLSTYT